MGQRGQLWAAVAVLAASCADGGGPCRVTPTEVDCPRHAEMLQLGLFTRDVFWRLPEGEPPAAGWPAAIVFQGSLFSAAGMWSGQVGQPLGQYFQANTLRTLVDAGFVVITPATRVAGTTAWDTNIPPFAGNWESAPDHTFMLALFDRIAAGTYGRIDVNRLYAAGISSGGYMTSRMAVSYPGRFRALAVHSASYATCAGPLCEVPTTLPSGHPPTLFLHGEKDPVVPLSTMVPYRDGLADAGVETARVTAADLGHEWLPDAPNAIRDFFVAHP